MTKEQLDIQNDLKQGNMDRLKAIVNGTSILDVIQIMKQLGPGETVLVFRLLEKDRALKVFEQLDTEMQEHLITSFAEEKAIEIISDLSPDDRARLLDELPARVAKKLLSNLSSEERKETADLLGYPPETAGRIMTPDYIRLKMGMTAEESIEKIRKMGEDVETVYVLYITDEERKLLGAVSLRQLVMASPETRVEQIMSRKPITVHTEMDQEEAARLIQQADLLAVPVVDRENRLVGIITIDDAVDVLDEEATEDIFDKAGLASLSQAETNRSQRLVNGSLVDIWKVRIPFLLITLAGGLGAGAVIGGFEETLEAIAAVAIFIPVVMDMGGNVGTQSSTIFARALVLGHINTKRFASHLLKEMGVGVTMGTFLGIGAGIIASLWQGVPGLGMAVGISLAITVTLATFLGFLIPYLLYQFGMDQAAGADPIITTIKDISGLFIYFMFVQYFLSALL